MVKEPPAADAEAGSGNEAEEDAPNAGGDQEWEWIYDEETVQRDRVEAEKRGVHHRRQWETTTGNSSRIKRHLSQLEEDHGTLFLDGGGGDLLPGSPSDSARGADAATWTENQKKMTFVASHMSKSKERFATFHKRRSQQEEGWKDSQARSVVIMEAAELRCTDMQRELMESQRRRAFNSAQKRSEQQKVLREVEKEKQRVWEAYYQQSHSKGGSGQAHSKSCSHGGAEPSPRSPDPPPVSRGKSMPEMADRGGEDDDIFKIVHQSHSRYAGQMDSWRCFVAENERRTDVQWKKALQGGRKEDYIGEEPKDVRDKLKGLFQKVVVGRTLGRKRKEDKAAVLLPELMGDDLTEDEEGCGFSSPSTVKSGAGSPMDHKSQNSAALSAKWHTRRQKSLLFGDEVEQSLLERGLRDEQHLKEARERIAQHNRGITDRCKDQASIWLQKSENCADRRRNQAVANDEEYVAKHTAAARRMQEVEDRCREIRKQKNQERLNKMMKFQESGRGVEQGKIDATLDELAKLDAAIIERQSIKKAEADARKARDNFEERRDQAKEKKADELKAKALKVRKELREKKARSEKSFHNLHMSVFERERQHKERRKAGLSLSGEPPSPSGASDGGLVLPRLSGTMSLPILLRPVDASPIMPPKRRQREDSDTEAKSEASDESGAAGQAEFLQQLGSKCGEWLTDLRRNMRTAAV
mmetsp:Transcript_96007/g.250283  ORF Transcript_96007/g.250283 Transcript_96007/m.250283 type:complete len:699 (+) Transcript_96007:103-2199(+)